MSTPGTAAAAQTAQTPSSPATDPAVEFLTSLAPQDPMVRRRAFTALLRAVVNEGSVR